MDWRRGVISACVLLAVACLVSCKAKEEASEGEPLAPQGAPGAPLRKVVGGKTQLTIFYPTNLSAPLQGVTAEFEKQNPNFTVKAETGSSVELARRVAEKGERADLVMSSDYALIQNMMVPKSASWYLKFARNYVTIAFTEKSQFADKVNSFNWYEFLVKPDVKVGYCDPNLSALGYRALMAMQLAERYYDKKGLYEELRKNCPEKNISPNSDMLLKNLESGQLDYAWLYRSVAKQRGLKLVVLPPEVDLSSGSFSDMYKQAKVEIAGLTPGSKTAVAGEPILYGLTIPANAASPEAAIAYIKLLLSPGGQEICKKNSQMLVVPCEASDLAKVPAELAALCKKPKTEVQAPELPAGKPEGAK